MPDLSRGNKIHLLRVGCLYEICLCLLSFAVVVQYYTLKLYEITKMQNRAHTYVRAEELILKHEDDEVVLIVLLFRLRIATFMEFSPLR